MLYSLSLQTTVVTYNKISLRTLLSTNLLPNFILILNVTTPLFDWLSLLWTTCRFSNKKYRTQNTLNFLKEESCTSKCREIFGFMYSYNILYRLVIPRYVFQDYECESFGSVFRFILIWIFGVIFWKFQPFHYLWPAVRIKTPL